MKMVQRYRRLTFWNKLGFWGGLASIFSVAVPVGLAMWQAAKPKEQASAETVELCGAAADTRASLLEVEAEAGTRDHAGRSRSRDALENDLRNLTKYANRTRRRELATSASNARIAATAGLNLPPPKDEQAEAYKTCLLVRFLFETESILAYCRDNGLLAAEPDPLKEAEARGLLKGTEFRGLLSNCEAEFVK